MFDEWSEYLGFQYREILQLHTDISSYVIKCISSSNSPFHWTHVTSLIHILQTVKALRTWRVDTLYNQMFVSVVTWIQTKSTCSGVSLFKMLLVQSSSSVSTLHKSSQSCRAATVGGNGNTSTGPLLFHSMCSSTHLVSERFMDAHLIITSSGVNCLQYGWTFVSFVTCDHFCLVVRAGAMLFLNPECSWAKINSNKLYIKITLLIQL